MLETRKITIKTNAERMSVGGSEHRVWGVTDVVTPKGRRAQRIDND